MEVLDPAIRHQQSILGVEVRAVAARLVEYLLQGSPVVRMHSPQQQLEKLVLFWHGHFATSAEKVPDPRLMLEQNALLRRLARAHFGELAQAISIDPAIMSGTPCFHGTRVPVAVLFDNLADGHPEFAAIRENRRDPTTIKLNHALHMKPIRRGPTGPIVQLECVDCHRPAAAKNSWTYADASYAPGSPSSKILKTAASVGDVLSPRNPPTGRELMAPVTFANACGSCHLLSFDKRFSEGVPHDKPEVIHAFLKKKFQDYAATHPSELRSARDPDRDITGKPFAPRVQTLTAAQWVAVRTSDAEQLLWRKTCLQCHQLSFNRNGKLPYVQQASATSEDVLPHIAEAGVIARWMPHAKFDHEAHGGFTCVSCHEKALRSFDSSDSLLPGIKTCQTCHAPGPDHAESRCFECHTYHDWSKRKEITPTFSFPPVRTGGL